MSQSPHMSLVSPLAASVNKNESDKNSNRTARESIGKIVCVGRNYAAHARELGNDVPTSPILFMKPASSIVSVGNDIVRPDPTRYGDTHYEAELCIQLSADLSNATIEQAQQAIGRVTLGLDLTLRDLQSQLKDKGQPWERAKCFDGACVLANWIDPQAFGDFSQVQYQLTINDELKQDGDSGLMLFPVYELLAEISHAFSLQAGDVIMTGTPSGVGVLQAGDRLRLKLGEHEWQAQVQ
ncbi:fumarylacetoacetate hydrolase family protein [Psychrobacter sp. LV10R520-6]|uniref:fumarylacetoacetate hydrolase family protein n=1 Tax=Psychrobacter sp. LV10R520-6 TaxID=1415574 RepID=UPI0024CA7193|nr:fumarylacetoacetate hydrolase family protein [Psychrobacter sp. LV10R520-6]SNT71461.1 2-keto-4-pentenoate hydratase/2-oxohepta-3-ene-1,7-dioic acid hydratase (catechol pathway) [Psychrobacter sp. LV10R520-6]